MPALCIAPTGYIHRPAREGAASAMTGAMRSTVSQTRWLTACAMITQRMSHAVWVSGMSLRHLPIDILDPVDR